jgi:hypothetical protein
MYADQYTRSLIKKSFAQNRLNVDFLMWFTSPQGYGTYIKASVDDREILAGMALPSRRVTLHDARINGHTVTYDGLGAMDFRTEQKRAVLARLHRLQVRRVRNEQSQSAVGLPTAGLGLLGRDLIRN